MTESVSAQAWSDLVLGAPALRFLDLEEVERLDEDAVLVRDLYEYRYHRGGSLTWFSKAAPVELPVRSERAVPGHLWLHLPSCACAACAPSRRRPPVTSSSANRDRLAGR